MLPSAPLIFASTNPLPASTEITAPAFFTKVNAKPAHCCSSLQGEEGTTKDERLGESLLSCFCDNEMKSHLFCSSGRCTYSTAAVPAPGPTPVLAAQPQQACLCRDRSATRP